ncbi:MAG: bifunctional 4-hydroxy-2-oxoglutarate aldolase/2-dehydro-3-deoxy-phosphogluconate aldolase [Actinomycetota bacterium]|nr:bifunctional 4-hydroxy-2-oxoglutarate aldolase/2-dehydro-3-deoxy-phosphogluconate aldolase [Actinomycetota bacterium]
MSARPVAPEEVIERIIETRMIAILRGFTPEEAVRAGRALAAGGARVLEVSLVDPQASRSIERLREELGAGGVVGAGTVITESGAKAALEAGADFLFSPGLNQRVVATAEAHGALAIPGVLTASEVTSALALGTRLMKLFPAEPLGPAYLKQMLGPFPNLRLAPTGGVGTGNAAAYLSAGAVAVGAGTSVANPAWAHENRYELFEQAAADLLRSLGDTKGAT